MIDFSKNKVVGNYFLRYGLVSFLIVFWVWKQEKKKIWYSLRKEKKRILRTVLKSLFFFALLHFAFKFILTSIAPDLLSKSEKINMLGDIIADRNENPGRFGLIIFGLCVLAPIIEECIFRYFIFYLLGKKNPFSYFFSFFSFVLAHYHWEENIWVLFFQYSAASLGFIYVYGKSRWNLLAPILLHSLANFLFIMITLLSPSCSLI